MNITGIICEYNPLHNGHVFHLMEARRRSEANYVVCIMSGSFMQRGEPAIVDKWTRARMALLHGADLVLELPSLYAVRAAQDFARGAVATLDALGCVTHLAFGSELPLEHLKSHSIPEDSRRIRAALARGESYPRAVGSAGGALTQPNATLGIEYIRSIDALGSRMQPVVIERHHMHDAPGLHSMASASAIRQATRLGASPVVAMPQDCLALYDQALTHQGGPAGMEQLFPLVLHLLRNAAPESLTHLPGAGEGLENRLVNAALHARDIHSLLRSVKCKRYTMARIRRLLIHAALQTPPSLAEGAIEPTYARVLGFRKQAAPLLRQIDQGSRIPLLTKLPRAFTDPCLRLDLYAQNLWALCCPRPLPHQQDYTHSLVLL